MTGLINTLLPGEDPLIVGHLKNITSGRELLTQGVYVYKNNNRSYYITSIKINFKTPCIEFHYDDHTGVERILEYYIGINESNSEDENEDNRPHINWDENLQVIPNIFKKSNVGCRGAAAGGTRKRRKNKKNKRISRKY
jgi:hypothetical protein